MNIRKIKWKYNIFDYKIKMSDNLAILKDFDNDTAI